MPLVLDTGIVYAYYDRADQWHERARAAIAGGRDGLLLPAPVIPEVDYLLRHRIGVDACRVFYQGLTNGAYLVADLPAAGYARVVELSRLYADLGFVDASVIAVAESRRVRRIATTDRRHFGPLAGVLSLELVPDTP